MRKENEPEPAPRRVVLIVSPKPEYQNPVGLYAIGRHLSPQAFNSAEDAIAYVGLKGISNIGLVVTEIDLPNLDGFGLVRILREGNPDLPVVFFTEVDTPPTKEAMKRIGSVTNLPMRDLGKAAARMEYAFNLVFGPYSPTIASEPARQIKVLIVDDEEIVSKMTSLTLMKAGMETHIAANGLEGLKKVGEVNPDVIITDRQMPMMDGLEFIRVLRMQKVSAPIILFCSHPGERILNEIDPYISRFVEKGLPANVLVEAVKSLSASG